jgi:hypothetical protein
MLIEFYLFVFIVSLSIPYIFWKITKEHEKTRENQLEHCRHLGDRLDGLNNYVSEVYWDTQKILITSKIINRYSAKYLKKLSRRVKSRTIPMTNRGY